MAKREKPKKSGGTGNSSLVVFVCLVLSFFVAWKIPQYRNWAIICGGAIFTIWSLIALRRYRIFRSMTHVDKMDGIEFEKFLVQLFNKSGYKTRHIGGSGGDFGADLIIEKKGLKIAIQAKNYSNSKVGNDAVQQAVAGASYYDCEQAMVVTNSTFTKAAKQQAAGSNIVVTLWDRRNLKDELGG